MKITHLGHACVLVETGGARILIDPGAFSGFDDVSDLSGVFITHQHMDHVDAQRLPALLERSPDATLFVEAETASQLSSAGVPAAQTVGVGETIALAGATVTGVGGQHAEIDPDIPRIGNVGLLVTADDEPTFFHPGDAYEYTPSGVDVLGVPLNAPWAKLSETVAFGRAVAPRVAFPIHDWLLKPQARGVYLGNLGKLLGASTELTDLFEKGETSF